MNPQRLRSLLAAGGLATIAAVALAVSGGGSTPASAADTSVAIEADGLANEPTPGGFDNVAAVTGAAASQRAGVLSSAVPLPPGESFADINWDAATYSDADVEGLLEFNAACKWWIADADAPTKLTARVVHVIPSWPTMRGGDRHRAALSFTPAGEPDLAPQVLAFCRASVK